MLNIFTRQLDESVAISCVTCFTKNVFGETLKALSVTAGHVTGVSICKENRYILSILSRDPVSNVLWTSS